MLACTLHCLSVTLARRRCSRACHWHTRHAPVFLGSVAPHDDTPCVSHGVCCSHEVTFYMFITFAEHYTQNFDLNKTRAL